MKFESFEEIVNYAIEKENEAAAFYADAAKKEPFSGVKEALEEMANEEKKHAAMLEKLRLAMKREEKALAMYNELQNKTDNEEHIKLFKALCQEEAKHKLFLEKLYDDYMAEQGD